MSAAPARVLVVDDERPIRKLLRTGLATQGYEILEAPDGKAALELLAQHGADEPSERGEPVASRSLKPRGRKVL